MATDNAGTIGDGWTNAGPIEVSPKDLTGLVHVTIVEDKIMSDEDNTERRNSWRLNY